ncbi:hypothetical protein STRDD11_02584 [Streptococcus sp. DD11]|nr:hypothetical protein STRDD11_02584 [Streptococcus sp. DD11]
MFFEQWFGRSGQDGSGLARPIARNPFSNSREEAANLLFRGRDLAKAVCLS